MKINPKDNELYVVRGHQKDENQILRMDNVTWVHDGVHPTENCVKSYYKQVSKFINFL
jgi:transposase